MRNTFFVLSFLAGPVAADTADDAADFVRNNLLATFYHEFGHALVDVLDLPIYAREEDAADNASVMLIEALYEEAAATQMVMDTADAFWVESWEEAEDMPTAGVHGLSEQRYFNTLCIYYGGNPVTRTDVVDVMGLPEDRAESCVDEYAAADHSWGNVFRELARDNQNAPGLVFDVRSDAAPLTASLIAEEVAALNAAFQLPLSVPVEVADCGEPNAFYFPDENSITMCTEYESYLYDLYSALEE